MMDENEYWVVQPKPTLNGSIGVRNHNVNDSGDSIASVIIPKRALCLTRNTSIVVDQYRNVDAKDFFLCLCSIILLMSGIGLVGESIWTLITRIPYIYISEHVSYLGIVSFTICSGLLCFPSSWLAWGAHTSKPGYIPLLTVFLCVSIVMLATGTALGTVHRSRITFEWIANNHSYKSFVIKNLTIYEESKHMYVYPHLQKGTYQSALNSSMIGSLYSYDTRAVIKYGWDTIHQRFRCCGVNSPYDWLAVRSEIPDSCCKKFYVYNANNNQTKVYHQCTSDNMYLGGCLDSVAYDLAHQSALLTSIGYIVLFLELITLIIIAIVYVRMRISQRSPLRPSVSHLSYCYSATPRQSTYGYSQRPSFNNILPMPQVYYRYIQPPTNIQLQQLQRQDLQQQQVHSSPISPEISRDICTQIKDNYELMNVPN